MKFSRRCELNNTGRHPQPPGSPNTSPPDCCSFTVCELRGGRHRLPAVLVNSNCRLPRAFFFFDGRPSPRHFIPNGRASSGHHFPDGHPSPGHYASWLVSIFPTARAPVPVSSSHRAAQVYYSGRQPFRLADSLFTNNKLNTDKLSKGTPWQG